MKLTYKINEKKLLISRICQKDKEQKKETIEQLVNDTFLDTEFSDITMEININNKQWIQKFTCDKTGDVFYTSNHLPVIIRLMYNELFNKLYWKYCN